MSRSPFRTSIWRRRNADETPDPACIPGDAEIPQAYCVNCGLLLTGDYDIDMADGTPIERLWCARCGRSVEVNYV